jgi:hypothetical protein
MGWKLQALAWASATINYHVSVNREGTYTFTSIHFTSGYQNAHLRIQ